MSGIPDDASLITLGELHSPIRQLIVIHGFGMYNELYRSPIESILQESDQARIYNIPGHGAATSFPDAVEPTVSRRASRALVDRIVANAQDLSESDTFVIGESLGCAIAAQVASRLGALGSQPAGVVMAAPPLILNPVTLLRWSIQSFSRPRSTLTNGVDIRKAILEMVGDPELARKIVDDPAVAQRVSLGYVVDSVASLIGMATSEIRHLHAPILALIGQKDPLVSRVSLRIVTCLAPAKDKTALVIPRARHSLFWDPETATVCQHIREWMDRRG